MLCQSVCKVYARQTALIAALFIFGSCGETALQGMAVSSDAGLLALTYKGADGQIDYQWVPPSPGATNTVGSLRLKSHLEAVPNGGFDIPLLVQVPNVTLTFREQHPISAEAGKGWDLTYSGLPNQDVHILARPCLNGRSLTIDLESTNAVMEKIKFGLFPASVASTPVEAPYYSGAPVYLASLGLFADLSFDWQSSNATLLRGNEAIYAALTNGKRNTMKERIVLTASANVDDVFPAYSLPVSPHLHDLSGKLVIDIWQQANFLDIAQGLTTLGDYGVKNCVVIIHDWQRSGYDNALPAHFPANDRFGGDEALIRAVAAGRKIGCSVALHENYVDYYPDYEFYSVAAVARTSDNQLVKSWFNPIVHVQSVGTKPTWYLRNARTQSPVIHNRYRTSASFIDVNSAVLPWWRADMDANEPDAGMFRSFFNANQKLWDFERKTHEGPVFGEGLRHAYWSGLLDGVEAQFGVGVPLNDGPKAPLFVDFDLLTIHPHQVNHGMGYYGRWVAHGEDFSHTDQVDAYRMQEVAYGHAPYIDRLFWTNVPRVITEQNLVAPVAKRYGTQTVTKIQYELNGTWADSSAAVKAKDWSRVKVEYANGDTIVANSQKDCLSWEGYQLPQYGWVARGKDLLAYTAMKDGLIVDYAETADSFFANARNQTDLIAAGAMARVNTVQFQANRKRSFEIQLRWQVLGGSDTTDVLKNFLHVTDAKGVIAFQSDRIPSIPTSQWKPGQTINDEAFMVNVPLTTADGRYLVKTGLFGQRGGQRVKLDCQTDGNNACILGDLVIADGGKTITFNARPDTTDSVDPRLNSKGRMANFDTLRTDGLVSLIREGNSWTMRTYPRNRPVTVQLKADRLKAPAAVTCDSPQAAQATPAVVNGYWQVRVNGAKTCSWIQP